MFVHVEECPSASGANRKQHLQGLVIVWQAPTEMKPNLNVCVEEVLLHWVYCLVDERKLSSLMDVVFLSLNLLSSMDKLFTLCNILIMNVSSALLGKSRE